MAINPWRCYELMQKSKELDNQIISIFGKNKFEELEKYVFEFSCEEARFLGIKRESFEGEIEYMVAFNRLCRFRREAFMGDILEIAKELEEKVGSTENLRENIELNLDYSLIPLGVREIYKKG